MNMYLVKNNVLSQNRSYIVRYKNATWKGTLDQNIKYIKETPDNNQAKNNWKETDSQTVATIQYSKGLKKNQQYSRRA